MFEQYDPRHDPTDGWWVEGNRVGNDWNVRATHLASGESWLALKAHSFDAGREECVKAIVEKLELAQRAPRSSADPEPPPGTSVTDALGRPWSRDSDGWTNPDGAANWTRDDVEDDPESWVKVAGNYGPVQVKP